MKMTRECELRDYLTARIAKACKKNLCEESGYLKLLVKDIGVKGGRKQDRCFCCTLSFIIYICFFCSDVNALIEELRSVIMGAYGAVER